MMYPTQVKILLVEDESSIRTLLRIFLESLGCVVIEAKNGREGLKRYQELPVDAVISDIYMPEMNGLELIKAIHHDDPMAVIISMSADPEQLSLARDLGAQKTITKPFDLDEWRGVLDWIRQSKSIGRSMFAPPKFKAFKNKLAVWRRHDLPQIPLQTA